MKPLIAISPQLIEQKGKKDALGSYRTYLNVIEKHGGIPVILNYSGKPKKRLLSRFEGLLLCGGDDLHPKYLRLKRDRQIPIELSPNERSEFELQLARLAYRERIPTLGICLGAQTMNVARDGTIYQDLGVEFPPAQNHRKGNHEILLAKGTLLARILRKPNARVNSRHHQANRKPGKGLVISAYAPDGVGEAIEAVDHPFYLGLQWHPEEAMDKDINAKVFRAFIRAARR